MKLSWRALALCSLLAAVDLILTFILENYNGSPNLINLGLLLTIIYRLEEQQEEGKKK